MPQSFAKLQAGLMLEYYRYFSKYARGKSPNKKVAWVTSFAPVEILEALDIAYYYPESYAAVIAASDMEQPLLEKSEETGLCRDCCSYSCCIQGCLELRAGPRGTPPKPDILIATNNQCNTLPGWWSILAERYHVPLIVLDYPGDTADRAAACRYVTEQHKRLIEDLEALSGNTLDPDRLAELINNSRSSVKAWGAVIQHLKDKEVVPTLLFDDINFLITARCKPETAELYSLMASRLGAMPAAAGDRIPLFWVGYPLWYHPDRYLPSLLEGCRLVGSNYITWWSLDYTGPDPFACLFNAYNDTFLNLSQQTRNRRLKALIEASGARGAVVLRNKSCKCDFVSARNIGIPKAELEIDMIDRTYLDEKAALEKINLMKEIICAD